MSQRDAQEQARAEWERDTSAREIAELRTARASMLAAMPELLAGLARVAGHENASGLLARVAELRGEHEPPLAAHALLLLVDVARALGITAGQLGRIVDVALVDPEARELTRRGVRAFGMLPSEVWESDAFDPVWQPIPNAPSIAPMADSLEWCTRFAGECAELADSWPGGSSALESAASEWVECMRTASAKIEREQRARAVGRVDREHELSAELAAVRAELAAVRTSQREQASSIAAEVARMLRSEP